MARRITVSPAYGRDYLTADAAREAWRLGKDFIHNTRVIFGGGTYCSKRDFSDGSASPRDEVWIRYKQLTEICPAVGEK